MPHWLDASYEIAPEASTSEARGRFSAESLPHDRVRFPGGGCKGQQVP